MSRPDLLSQLLPYTFTNGVTISRFAKLCPHCQRPVEANGMYGQIVAINERLFLAARAECRHCECRFPIACMIDNQRRVQPVFMPLWLFNAVLSMMARQRVSPNDPTLQLSPEALAALPPLVPSLSTEDVTEAKQCVGSYDGIEIPAWIEHNGQRLEFVRVIPPNLWPQLESEERLYRRRLVFRFTSHVPEPILGA